MEIRGGKIDQLMLKVHLLEEAEEFCPVCNKYVIDELAKRNNKYPIKLAWASVKHHVRMNDKTFKLPDVKDI